MDVSGLTTAERLVAEQAVVGYREVCRAMRGAPHGRGLAMIEQAVVAQMRKQGVAMMEQALRDAAEAEQKGGAAVDADGRRRSGAMHG
jgi:5,10-methenyltetrahydromethanopterin hydrogenase